MTICKQTNSCCPVFFFVAVRFWIFIYCSPTLPECTLYSCTLGFWSFIFLSSKNSSMYRMYKTMYCILLVISQILIVTNHIEEKGQSLNWYEQIFTPLRLIFIKIICENLIWWCHQRRHHKWYHNYQFCQLPNLT